MNKNIKIAGHVLHLLLGRVEEKIIPGITTKEIDDWIEMALYWHSPKPTLACKGFEGFPCGSCISINEEIIHGIPGKRIIKEGDLVKVDVVLEYKGWYADSARTFIVGKGTEQSRKLVRVTKECLYKGIEVAKHRWTTGDIGFAIQSHAEKNGFSVMREFGGHGIGQQIHQDPRIPCFGKQRKGVKLVEGMYICIEPMLFVGKPDIIMDKKGYNVKAQDGLLTAHFEHTIEITKGKAIVIT